MTDQKDIQDAKWVIEQYVEACRSGNVDLLRAIFHPTAQMVGFLGGNLMYGGPDPFFDAVAGNPSPEDSGQAYQTEISDVAVSGAVAQATLKEIGFMGLNFVDYFHLLKSDGEWKIISKCFAHD